MELSERQVTLILRAVETEIDKRERAIKTVTTKQCRIMVDWLKEFYQFRDELQLMQDQNDERVKEGMNNGG